MKLQDWIDKNVVSDEMFYKGSAGHQFGFLNNELTGIFSFGLPYDERRNIANVISTHRSKSISLPVVQFVRKDLGARFTVRDNFFNWKLSVDSKHPIVADFTGLFHTTPPIDPDYTGDPLHSVYFEGFPEELVYGYYEPSDKKKWSAEIHGDKPMWTTAFLIMRQLGAVKAFKWNKMPEDSIFRKDK